MTDLGKCRMEMAVGRDCEMENKVNKRLKQRAATKPMLPTSIQHTSMQRTPMLQLSMLQTSMLQTPMQRTSTQRTSMKHVYKQWALYLALIFLSTLMTIGSPQFTGQIQRESTILITALCLSPSGFSPSSFDSGGCGNSLRGLLRATKAVLIY